MIDANKAFEAIKNKLDEMNENEKIEYLKKMGFSVIEKPEKSLRELNIGKNDIKYIRRHSAHSTRLSKHRIKKSDIIQRSVILDKKKG